MNPPARTRSQIVDYQVHLWELQGRPGPARQALEPVITLSRLPGCAGKEIALELARRTGFEFFDKEILHRVSVSSSLSEATVRMLDDKVMRTMDEVLMSMALRRCLPWDFRKHLESVLGAIAHRGRAVILGRGANFLIPPEQCLRVLLVAPKEARVRSLADRVNLPLEDARRQIYRVESDRRSFIRRHFHADMTDPVHYDLALNSCSLGRDGTVEAILTAWQAKKRTL